VEESTPGSGWICASGAGTRDDEDADGRIGESLSLGGRGGFRRGLEPAGGARGFGGRGDPGGGHGTLHT